MAAALHEPVKVAVLVAAVLVLVALVGYPLFLVFKFSLITPEGGFSVRNFALLFEQRGVVPAAVNSLLLAIYVPLGCLAIGVPLAYLVSRTNMPGRTFIRGCAGAAFVIPSFITVIGWVFLAAPNSGQLNKLARALFGAESPILNIYSFSGLVFIEVAHFFPIVFFAVAAALDNIDASYEHAARILGAGRLRTAATVTIPLVGPAIISSSILCSIDALAAFGAPAAIGLPANFSVLTIKIYQLIIDPPRLELAAALSLPIVAFTLACLYVQRLYLRRNRFVTLGGKAGASQGVDLAGWRWPLFGACLIVCLITVVLPLCALVALSLLKTFGATISLKNLTLDNYAILFDPSVPFRASFYNSFVLAIATACCCAALALLYVWIVERTSVPARGAITGFVMVTYGLPPVALGVGIILGYVSFLYGTLTILLIGYIAKHLPIGFVIIRNTIKQITPELEEAARVSGATWLRSMRDVTIPLLKPGIWVAWAMIFALSLRELPLSIMLVQPGTEVMSVAVLNLIESAFLESAAAISILIVAFSVISIFAARLVAGRGALEIR
jgi:iron(III) transport system permease protein